MTWDLGVLFGKGDRLPDRSAPALQILADCGLTKPDDELVGVIRIALMHRSYLYENQDLLPGIKPKHLDALALVGSIFRRRTAAINTYQRYETATNGLLSRDVNHIDTVLPSWTAKADWFRSSTLLGKGYTTSELPRKALASLFDQLVGLLCLADESAIAEALLADLFTQARSGSEIVDPKTTLQEILSGRSLQYEYSRTGPDHAASHHAVVTDQAGRSGTGDGGNKTAASQAAALDFIQTHCLDLLPTNPLPSGAPRIPYPITTPVAHANEVARLQEIFNLPPSARGLLSQALIHRSWAYENPRAMRETGQQDNQTLAFLGSTATWHEYTLAVGRSVLNSEQVSDQGFTTPQNSTYAEAFHRAGCTPGLLLGKGLAREATISTTLASDTFQALFAAVLMAKHSLPTLEESWPDSWQPIWGLIAPDHTRPEGANPRLEGLTRLIHLSVEHRIEAQGPEHARRFRAVTDLDSAALGRLVTLTGSFEHSKAKARAHTALPLLALIDALAEDIPSLTADLATAPAQFLVAHLATVFATDPSRHVAWARKRLLGLHLVHSSSRLLTWANAVDRLIGNDIGPCPIPSLASAYAQAMSSAPAIEAFDPGGPDLTGDGPFTQAIRTATRALPV